MKFRVRAGFRLFRTIDEALEFEFRGEKSGVTPLAEAGQVHEYPLSILGDLRRHGTLGKLEPVDAAARAYYGDTRPMISRRITNPEIFVAPTPDGNPFWR